MMKQKQKAMKLRYQLIIALLLSIGLISYLNLNNAPVLISGAQEEDESAEDMDSMLNDKKISDDKIYDAEYIGSEDVLERKRTRVKYRDQKFGGIREPIPEPREEELTEESSTFYGYESFLQRKREEVDHYYEHGVGDAEPKLMSEDKTYPDIERDRVEVPIEYTGQTDEDTKVLERKRKKLKYIDVGYRVSHREAGKEMVPSVPEIESAEMLQTPGTQMQMEQDMLKNGKLKLPSGATVEFSNAQLRGRETANGMTETPQTPAYYTEEEMMETPMEETMPENEMEESDIPFESMFFGMEEDETPLNLEETFMEDIDEMEEMDEMEETNGGGGIEAGGEFDFMSLFPGI